MTQPSTVNMTFDTSLVDLAQESPHTQEMQKHAQDHPPEPNINVSFSTTEPDSEEDRRRIQPQPPPTDTPSKTSIPPKISTPIQHLPTKDAYDAWASVYDTDGNMLQAIDDLELERLLPDFLDRVVSACTSTSTSIPEAPSAEEQEISIIDLGCGTGRNTAKLTAYAWPTGRKIRITGLDLSEGMLEIARRKLDSFLAKEKDGEMGQRDVMLRLEQCNCFPTFRPESGKEELKENDKETVHGDEDEDVDISPIPQASGPPLRPASAILSTLLLEHIPLTPFFATLTSLLQPHGHALITNMHSDMGVISQAGFVNEAGVKVRPDSWAHTLEETVKVARDCGFEVLGRWEREVRREDVEGGRVGRRGGKWVGVRVWYGVLLRRGG
ncbi:S-adenosyl-L-methionine-dependent methyltransferase [Amniculicola lignicola CBS 123094]|uniref:S-adenosyl-L-methionine-dependent methyltransferase n=1 Tax=Amniculicola lignicola CBS 123094 TaxID=1392246 RepID=A0A6A5W1M8_9PLEO|nr:S-adenosyl-L-methionine-dependent methyltransferase [Amniculicola lignicola CBS 123094]